MNNTDRNILIAGGLSGNLEFILRTIISIISPIFSIIKPLLCILLALLLCLTKLIVDYSGVEILYFYITAPILSIIISIYAVKVIKSIFNKINFQKYTQVITIEKIIRILNSTSGLIAFVLIFAIAYKGFSMDQLKHITSYRDIIAFCPVGKIKSLHHVFYMQSFVFGLFIIIRMFIPVVIMILGGSYVTVGEFKELLIIRILVKLTVVSFYILIILIKIAVVLAIASSMVYATYYMVVHLILPYINY